MTLPQWGDSQEAAGFVLAGGESRRMGRDKALLELAGAPLITRALAILRSAGLKPSIAGARSNLSAFAPVVEDTAYASGKGPLSGICAALAAAQAQYVVFLPVDLPFLPPSLIAYMVAQALASQSLVILSSLNGHPQTFPAVVDRRMLPFLEKQLRSEERGTLSAFEHTANALVGGLSVLPVELLVQPGLVAHPLSLPPALWFLNVNSPRDFMRAQMLASGGIPVS